MANDYFEHSTNRVPLGARAVADHVNDIADQIESGFETLPDETELKNGKLDYAEDSGVANALVASWTYTPNALEEGLSMAIKVAAANTGPATLNASGFGAASLKRADGSDLDAGDIIADQVIKVRYIGTEFRITSSLPSLTVTSVAAADSATASASAASNSETAAGNSETAAAASSVTAAASETAAGLSETAASASASAASSDASTATTQAGNAATSASSASTSAGTATTQAGNAATSASEALASEGAAGASETNAASSASAASTSAGTSATQATNSSNSASAAGNSETAAAASEALAGLWAEENEDIEVETGLYSAKHWAIKSADAVANALTYIGVWDASTAAYPVGPTTGDMYKINVAGTISGTVYAIGDTIIYNGATWDKIDSSETVTSVVGRVGAVTISLSDLTDSASVVTTTGPHSISGALTVGSLVTVGTVDGRDVSADGAVLDLIEPAATADQTNAEIKTAYEANANTNAFTDTLLTKLGTVASSANNYTHPNHTGDVTSVADGALTIAANAVTLAKMADMATASFLGRVTAATGNPEVLTAAQARSILNVENGATADQTVTDLGLENVNNTSDANKPISSATQSALNNKLSVNGGSLSGVLDLAGYSEASATYGTSGAQAFDLLSATYFYPTGAATGAITFSFDSPATGGLVTSFTVELLNAGAQTITWPTGAIWPGGEEPTLSTSGIDIIVFTSRNGGTTWHGFVSGQDMS